MVLWLTELASLGIASWDQIAGSPFYQASTRCPHAVPSKVAPSNSQEKRPDPCHGSSCMSPYPLSQRPPPCSSGTRIKIE
jgi:hypothetical protein